MSRAAIHFVRFGPYHYARLRSAVEALSDSEVVGMEIAGAENTYAWTKSESVAIDCSTLFPSEVYESLSSREVRRAVFTHLDQIRPSVVAIAGWAMPDARACLAWCRKNGARAILMSETRKADSIRVWWKEWLKSCIVRRFDFALVGGKSHRDYLVSLGLPCSRILFGYNVIDNSFFARESRKWRQLHLQKQGNRPHMVRRLFLASNRFVARKNLTRLVEAFAQFGRRKEKKVGESNAIPISREEDFPTWDLCLLGDGDGKTALIAKCRDLGLQVRECAPWEENSNSKSVISGPVVFFPGFRQIEELPRFYAVASCFIHPALSEPWGLVLNEAMASNLPVLSSRNVGAAEELIDEGINGWTFNPESVRDLANHLHRVSLLSSKELERMGRKGNRILEDRCPTAAFGRGLAEAIEKAVSIK